MASVTSFGTGYLALSHYELKGGVFVPKANAPAVAAGAAPASAVAAKAGGNEDDLKFLLALGLAESKAKETLQNTELTADLKVFVAKVSGLPIDKSTANLVYEIATQYRKSAGTTNNVQFLLDHIKDKSITSKAQLEAALAYLKKNPGDLSGFNAAAGVGVVVTPEQIKAEVKAILEANKAEIAEKRYRTNTFAFLGALREKLPWADPKAAKDTFDAELVAVLGPRTAEDDAPVSKDKKKPAKPVAKEETAAAAAAEPEMTFLGAAARFHAPGHNDETEAYLVTPHTKDRLQEHLKVTGGKVMTRFPPEPNGILHIGHAKAMNFNFSYARERDGLCYLRFDDTNPEKEEKEFFDGIARDVAWLGHKPWKITYASDNFQQLYEWAVELIKKDLAYVCHQRLDEIRGHDNRLPSPFRTRPIEESLKLFEDMKNGLIDEGAATLRLKHEMEDGKLDPVAYRIKFTPHHRTGDAWCIYPTYDYTHCLCDSIENITHSLCTKEFQNRRYSYYWLCNAIDVYCPVQWEYSRLNMHYAVISKRKIAKLIDVGAVNGWDDPRLFTLSALRRKGYPPKAINDFCNKLGVTVASTVLGPETLEACVRDVLNTTSVRVMAVLDPVKVIIENFPADKVEKVKVPDLPLDPKSSTHEVFLSKTLFIERSDFETTAPKGYKRLTPTQAVGLKSAGYVITVKNVVEANGRVEEIHVTADPVTDANKPQAFIHWVSSAPGTAVPGIEVRMYQPLFLYTNPDEAPGGFLNGINPKSLTACEDALIDAHGAAAAVGTVFQFERVGYFCVDPDSKPGRLVFNCTVTLKEDASKNKKDA